MCGIAGSASTYPGGCVDIATLKSACRSLKHRGPDDEGFFEDPFLKLGMVRLSIIDLETGNQPIPNEDSSIVLVHNGEIYNYQTLREELEKKGHRFRTKSDSETILHAYEEYGLNFVDHLNGMFSLAVWDSRKKALVLARDRLGIKPLYYWYSGKELLFASELKALIPMIPDLPELDPNAVDLFMSLEYIPAPYTILKDVKKLPAGHLLTFIDGEFRLEQYWDVPDTGDDIEGKDRLDQLNDLLGDSVRLRMISDVPLGAFLSGGIDSSTILSYMSGLGSEPVRTYSIGFEDPTYNELPDARKVAAYFGSIHQDRILTPNINKLAGDLLTRLDEPLGDFSIIPTFLVSQLARENVKVVLSGDGGDEVFAGYEPYLAQVSDQYYRKLPDFIRRKWVPGFSSLLSPRPSKKGVINKFKRFVEGGLLNPELEHVRWMVFLQEPAKELLYEPGFRRSIPGDPVSDVFEPHFLKASNRDAVSRMQYVDTKTYLAEDILTKVDRMSMAVSLETRLPMLDHRLVSFGINLPPDSKISKFQTKKILRDLMRGFLPESTLKKPKQGFSIPLKNWLCGDLKPMMLENLSEENTHKRGIFSSNGVQQLIEEHLSLQANHSHILWSMIVLETWCQDVLDG